MEAKYFTKLIKMHKFQLRGQWTYYWPVNLPRQKRHKEDNFYTNSVLDSQTNLALVIDMASSYAILKTTAKTKF